MRSSVGSAGRRLYSRPSERTPAELQTTAEREPRAHGAQLRVDASQPRDVDGRFVSLGEHEDPLNLDLSDTYRLMQLLRQEIGHLCHACSIAGDFDRPSSELTGRCYGECRETSDIVDADNRHSRGRGIGRGKDRLTPEPVQPVPGDLLHNRHRPQHGQGEAELPQMILDLVAPVAGDDVICLLYTSDAADDL